MTLEDLGNIGEFVGAIGVIVTMIYLAYQIRQNTRQLEQNALNARAAAVNASLLSARENRLAIFGSAEVSEILVRGLADPAKLDEVEQYRFRMVIQNATDAMMVTHAETAITGYSPEVWETQGVNLARRIIGSAGGRWFWKSYRAEYPAEFRSEIDRILAVPTSGSNANH